jgi:hypothetical protein
MQVILIYYNIYISPYDILKDKDSTSIIEKKNVYIFYFILFLIFYAT